MDFYQDNDQQIENVDIEGYKEYVDRQEVERKQEKNEHKHWTVGRRSSIGKEVDSHSRATKKKKSKNKGRKTPSIKFVFKIIVLAAVCFNFKFIWSFMKDPMSSFTFYHTLIILGICAGINFAAVWIFFYKKSMIRLCLSVISILGSFGYYFYVNYTNHSFLGNNMLTSLLVIISVLMVINPKGNYYLKSIILLLISIVGIYLSGNEFALVWALMLSAGLILLFRMTKSKSESRKKDDQTRGKREQSA